MKLVSQDRNKYDVYILLILVSMIFGDFGGAFQAVRIIAILLLPQILRLKWRNNKYIKGLMCFFIVWYVYATLSFLWTPNKMEGAKELLYYPIHMLLFVELCVFSKCAKKPIFNIGYGWLWFVILTVICGIWEITTDQHLPMSSFQDGDYLFDNGEAVIHHFASVTFHNYNSYVVLLCSSLPFVLYMMVQDNKRIRYLTFFALVAMVYIIAINASRGGIICLLIAVLSLLFFSEKRRNLSGLFVIILASATLLYLYGDFLMQNILIRSQSTELLKDSSRTDLINDGIHVIFNDYIGMGAGIGGGFTALENYRHNGLSATHNLFLEIFVNFGIFILLMVVIGLTRMYMRGIRVQKMKRKLSIWVSLLTLVPFAIIDSGYLLSPQIWLYFASVYVFVYIDMFRSVPENLVTRN